MSREPRKLSRARRWARIFVWTTFVIVLCIRFAFPPARTERTGPGQVRFGQQQRRYRRPTIIRPPVSPVPADLWRMQIEIANQDVAQLRGYFWNGWRGARQERPEVQVTVREGHIAYTNVTLHLKGAAGSFRAFDDKPGLTLNFSKSAPGQLFHGYSKISLNNSVQDDSYLSEMLSCELFEAAGVPVPRIEHATVLVNGRDLGLYVLSEGFGKPFLKRYFKNVRGNLYDGGFTQEVTNPLDANSGDHPDDRSDLRRLAAAAREPDLSKRWEQLNQVLDMGRFISFLAMEIMTCHWDGYAMNRNNYRLFHDLDTDRMIFIPHGMDQMFGTFRSTPQSPIQPAMQGLVASAVMSTPSGRRLYLDRVANLRTNVFLEERWTNRLHELSRRIRPTLAAYGPDLAKKHDEYVAAFCQRITERAQSITEQLAARTEPVTFNDEGAAQLSDWKPRLAQQQPVRLRFDQTGGEKGKLLHISASSGGGTGSWRTRLALEAGQYRFQGRARTRGVGSAGGVCLRASGAQTGLQIIGERDWTLLHFDLIVDEPMADVELICELRASQGEAWFDEGSLRIIRQ